MKIYIVADYREQFQSFIDGDVNFNPHPGKSNIIEVKQAITSKGIECDYYGGIYELLNACNNKHQFSKETLFFNMSDGLTQSYCRLQAPVLLNLLGVKYTGSSPFAVALMNNKHYTKLAIKSNEVNIPSGFMIDKGEVINEDQFASLKYPLIIKPNNDGFSIGITSESVVHDYNQAINQISLLFNDFDEIIVEEYISGIDASVFLIGNKNIFSVNEVIAYKTHGKFHQEYSVRDVHTKANKLSEKYTGDAIFTKSTIQKVKKISIDIFNDVHAYDIARIDYRIKENGEIYFIEANACPILSPQSDVAVVCNNMGITYPDFIELYYETALSRYTN